MVKAVTMLRSLIVSFVVTLIMLLILALLMYKVDPKEIVITIGIAVTYLLSCFFGGFLTGKKIGEKKFLWGLGIGAAYFALLFIMSNVLEPGAMEDAACITSAMVLCLCGGMLGGMLS